MSESPFIEFDTFAAAVPQAVAALRTLSQIASEGLDKALVELIKIRASQINGCAYCLQLHVNWARKAGVTQDKLDQIAVWREAPSFTARERTALSWTEALTDVARRDEVHHTREALRAQFNEEQVVNLTLAVAAINAWNRIAGPLGFTPPSP